MSYSERELTLGEMTKNGKTRHIRADEWPRHTGRIVVSCFFVKKTSDKWLVTNLQTLNKVTVSDPWSIPQLVDVLDTLRNGRILSTLDLLKVIIKYG